MHGEDIHLTEIERQIAAAVTNLRKLIEQAASYSVATGEGLLGERIDDQAARLEILIRHRDVLLRSKT